MLHAGSVAISSCSLAPRHARANEHRLAVLVGTVHRKNVLGEIDSNVQNGHDFPFRVS